VTSGEAEAADGGVWRERVHATTHPAYRRDIDGLRTLAVLPVVLNHANVRGFSGGYVGVDIFFVISGFLITGILVRELEQGRYSLGEFYRRRVLRIFPALSVVLAICTVVAALVMLPAEMVRYARSLAATALFSSNILFLSESGYFDAASVSKPLLHTWSLAIEEQFYILWPLMLAAVGAHRPTAMKLSIATVSAISFVLAAIMVQQNASATFYLLPFRAWELGLGALLAVAGFGMRSRWINELLAAAGFAMILFAIARFDEATPFPGPAALLPCFGAALLIATGKARTLVGRLLSLEPVVFIGLISYSLYLWHWPVIVFARLALFVSPFDHVATVAQIAVCMILATLSWWLVERPFRVHANRWTMRQILGAGLAAMAAALLAAALIIGLRGMPGRYTAEQQALAGYLDLDSEQLYRRGTCFRTHDDVTVTPSCLERRTDRPAILLLGDSHAAHLAPGLLARSAQVELLQANIVGCRPLADSRPGLNCRAFFNRMLTQWAPANRADAVLLAGNWRPHDLPQLERTLSDPRVRAVNPVLIGPIPQYTAPVPRLLIAAEYRGDPQLLERSHLDVAFAMDAALRKIAARNAVPYISLIDALCEGRRCRTRMAPGIPMQFDYSHLTREGSVYVADTILRSMPGLYSEKRSDARAVPQRIN
jgi:peptidoglycan/LPS O-acetylase OafA/YrhL